MLKLKDWQQSVELASHICNMPPGDWTHTVDGRMVRVEQRVISPNGHKLVYFRGTDADGNPYCGRWMADVFDKESEPVEYEQLTLF